VLRETHLCLIGSRRIDHKETHCCLGEQTNLACLGRLLPPLARDVLGRGDFGGKLANTGPLQMSRRFNVDVSPI
jgi:hypothetical protein